MHERRMTRRNFMAGTVGAAAGWALAGSALAKSSGKRPPNILLIMSDEHHSDIMGCAGDPWSRTPNLDRLASMGVVFENAYCNSPLCVPSRHSFVAGKYISRVGAWNNDCWLPGDDYPSIARLLTAAGYESYLCGKMHFDRTHRYGFTEIGGNMNNSVKSGLGSRRAPDDLTPEPGISDRFNQFHTGETSGGMEHDQAVTRGVFDFLKGRTEGLKPFFLIAGFITPHFPLIVPEAFWKTYEGKIPLPVIPDGYLETLPLNYKHLRIGFNNEDVPEEIVRRGRELYYGLVEWMDSEIGKVLGGLEEAGLTGETLVIYTTDHGENMGEHGLWWKNCVYDSAAKVPLIVSLPGRWSGGQRRKGVCSLVDLAQTLADVAGAEVPKDWDGDSLVPYLEDPAFQWKDTAVSEYYAHNIASGYAMIRMGRYKYVYHTPPDEAHPAERELYDLEEDPGELKNLAGLPEQAERIQSMHRALEAELGESPVETEKRCRADYAQGYQRKDLPPDAGRKKKNR